MAFSRLTPLRAPLGGLFCAITCACGLFSCASDDRQRPITLSNSYSQPFEPPAEYKTRKYETRRVDFTGDGYDDAIVTVFPDSSRLATGFRRLVLYSYDSTRKNFAPVFQQDYFYGVSVDVRDVNRDGGREIVVKTESGGNSAVASGGLSVIARDKRGFAEIVSFDTGVPELRVVGADSVPVIIAHENYSGEYLPFSDAISYPDSIFVFSTNAAQADSARRHVYYEELARAQNAYKQAKAGLSLRPNDPKVIGDVYANAALQLLVLKKVAGRDAARDFRNQERNYWRGALPEPYSRSLDYILSRKQESSE